MSPLAGRAAARDNAGFIPAQADMAAPKSRRHKVVLETITQEKKKLRTALTFKADPPRGYTFIPAGHPELTNAMKEFARKGNYSIYAVSTTRHHDTHNLSKEVHRIGFHFPTVVVDEVCAHHGITLSKAGTIIREDDLDSIRQRGLKGKNNKARREEDQVTINTQARDAIKDLFPNIPDNDLFQIIKTAFQKGQKKVGTADNLPLVRRAQLSVVAHIRHVYTKYDSLLKTYPWNDARSMVEDPTLRKLVEWRGDDDNGKEALEDVLREVVVISDGEDSDEDMVDTDQLHRGASVELISKTADTQQIEVVASNYPQQPQSNGYDDPPGFSEHESSAGYRCVPRIARRRILPDRPAYGSRPNPFDAWDRAREQYRANPNQPLERVIPDTSTSHQLIAQRPRFADTGFIEENRQGHEWFRHPTTAPDSRPREETRPEQYSPPSTFHGASGVLYERIMPVPSDVGTPRRRTPPVLARPPQRQYSDFDGVRPRPPTLLRNRNYHNVEDDWNVLPSIEASDSIPRARPIPHDSRIPQYPNTRLQSRESRLQRAETSKFTSTGSEIIDLTDSSDRHDIKRRRLEDPFSRDLVSSKYDGGTLMNSRDPPQAATTYPPDRPRPADAPTANMSYMHPASRAIEAESMEPVRPVGPAPYTRVLRGLPLERQPDSSRHQGDLQSAPKDRSFVSEPVYSRALPAAPPRRIVPSRRDSFDSFDYSARKLARPEPRPIEIVPVRDDNYDSRPIYVDHHRSLQPLSELRPNQRLVYYPDAEFHTKISDSIRRPRDPGYVSVGQLREPHRPVHQDSRVIVHSDPLERAYRLRDPEDRGQGAPETVTATIDRRHAF